MGAVSLRPSDAQVGGFLDDVDVTFKELRFVIWDYQGKAKSSVALKVLMEDEAGVVHDQYYSAGDPTKYVPSADGRTIEPMAGATGLNQNTNVIAFITSLVNAGFPEDRLGEDVSIFDGLVAHVNQVAQPKRPGIKAREGEKADKTYLLVTKIVKLPWEAAAKVPAKGAPAPRQATLKAVAPPTPSPAPTLPPSDDVTEKARNTMLMVLMEKGGSVPKARLSIEAFRTLNNDPDRNAVVAVIYQESFLQSAKADGVITYDGTTVALGLIMLITSHPSTLADLNFEPGPPRREGIHVSACIKRLLIALEPERFSGALDMTRVEIGFTVERLIEEAWRLRRVNVIRPGDFERDGIIGSPDAITVDDEGIRVDEIKCTWMSSRGCPDDKRFIHWIWQIKAYCTLVETPRARLHVFFVNGDYKTREPQFLTWDLLFHEGELAENWAMLKNQAEAMKQAAP